MRERVFAILLVSAVLAACGGGGGSSSSSGTNTLPNTPSGGATAPATGVPNSGPTAPASSLPAGYAVSKFTIRLAAGTYAASLTTRGATAVRRAQTIGTGTVAISFSLLSVNGVATTITPQTFGLTASSTGCATQTDQSLSCVLAVDAPVGRDVFTATTYDANGKVTGSGAVQLTVAANATNTASLALTGQVSTVILATSAAELGVGGESIRRSALARRTAQQVGPVTQGQLYIIALDANDNIILNPAAFDAPIPLQLFFLDDENDITTTNPDLQLSVTYNAQADSGTACSGSQTTAVSYGIVYVCSPADKISVTDLNTGNGPYYAVVIGSPGSSPFLVPTPSPSSGPGYLPSVPSDAAEQYFYVEPLPTPTPSPTATGSLPINAQ